MISPSLEWGKSGDSLLTSWTAVGAHCGALPFVAAYRADPEKSDS